MKLTILLVIFLMSTLMVLLSLFVPQIRWLIYLFMVVFCASFILIMIELNNQNPL